MSDDKSGEAIMAENMAALEAGEDMPHDEDMPIIDDDVNNDIDDGTKELAEDLEAIASKDGYQSKEEWVESGKDPEDYMTKEEFAKVGDMRDGGMTRQQMSKSFVQLESAMKDMLSNQNQMLTDARNDERKKTLIDLEAKKKEAIDFQDTSEAIKLDREIVKLENESKPKTPEAPTNVQSWHDSNKHWYDNDTAAAGLVNSILAKNDAKGASFEDAIKEAETAAKKHFPYHFDDTADTSKDVTAQNRKPLRRTETGRSPKAKADDSNAKKFSDLDPAMATIARKAAKATGMTEKEYMENFNV
jgi:hypothetical protein